MPRSNQLRSLLLLLALPLISVAGGGASSQIASPVVLAAGDIAACGSKDDDATARLIARRPGTVLTLGDLAYEDGSREQFSKCYAPSWGRFKRRTRPAPGNHEYNTPGAAGYFNYFGAAAGPGRRGYYSFELGSWHMVSLNSNCSHVACSTGSAQERWLRADLKIHQTRCTLAYWHHPRFSSGTTHGSQHDLEAIWQALYDYGADVVLNGHEHNYERFAPQTPSGARDTARGIRQFVAGTGGRSHYRGFRVTSANSQVRNGNSFGVLRLVLHPDRYSWRFIPVAGSRFTDSGSTRCHE